MTPNTVFLKEPRRPRLGALRRVVTVIACLVGGFAAAADRTEAAIVTSTLGLGAANGFIDNSSTFWSAQQFQITSGSWDITSVVLNLGEADAANRTGLVQIRADSGGNVGSVVANGAATDFTASGFIASGLNNYADFTYNYTGAGLTLGVGTYWLVNGSNTVGEGFNWGLFDTGAGANTSTGDGGIVTFDYGISDDSGASFSVFTAGTYSPQLMQINAADIAGVPEPGGLALGALGLGACLILHNRRKPRAEHQE